MMRHNIHVLPQNDRWAVKSEGSTRPYKIFEEKREALRFAHQRTLREDTCIFIHKKDGKVSSVKCPARRKSTLLREFQHKYGLE